jgi:hypothetical protein
MTLAQNIMSLTANERATLFAMLTEQIDILIKVIPEITLLRLIKSDNFTGYEQDPMVQAYLVWKQTN